MRLLAPDDAADVIQAAPPAERAGLLALLEDTTRIEVTALLAYAEDEAGGLMNPRFARVRPDMSVDEAISYLRRQAREQLATIYYVYVLDGQQRLLGVVSFRELFAAPGEKTVREVMRTAVITVSEQTDQEAVSLLFARHDLMALPVVDAAGHLKGIVTVDDIVDVVQEEATEDIQKIGGTQALDDSYLHTGFARMVRKRAGWLSALFLGEMLTATAMGYYENEIARAVVLAFFIPLIISSGGNSGSQASTLIIRAMTLGEVRLRDWWRVIRRELAAGLVLGMLLGAIGLVRILFWPTRLQVYGEHYALIGLTVAFSLVGVVLFGTVVGSMLPFILRWMGFDPASASAPFVATLVDVSGLVIYFTVASLILQGVLL
jgi:magnesium transporter